MHRVLILPIGTEIGLEIYRALRFSKHFEVFGISSDPNNHGRFLCGDSYIHYDLPPFNDEWFWNSVSDIVRKYSIDFIYPASPLLFDHLDGMPPELNIILPPLETVEICRSKRKTYKKFRKLLRVPISPYSGYPMFLKPNNGQGAENSYKVNNESELSCYGLLIEDPLYLEYISGPEYTVDCFTDRHGKLRFAGARIRNRIKNGISVNSKRINNKQFVPIAQTINSNLEMRGGWFFQVKGKDLTLLEIEPRIAGTSGIWRQVGVNLPLLTLYDYCGKDVTIHRNKFDIELDRAFKARFKTDIKYDTVYIDLDDTLIINGKVNTKLISFLFQCRNNNKKIILLTRNKTPFDIIIHRGIAFNFFHEVTPIGLNSSKSDFVEPNSILIDDSFGERKEVADKLKIPVFDVDAIDCLMEQ
jgi:hypothetical protein